MWFVLRLTCSWTSPPAAIFVRQLRIARARRSRHSLLYTRTEVDSECRRRNRRRILADCHIIAARPQGKSHESRHWPTKGTLILTRDVHGPRSTDSLLHAKRSTTPPVERQAIHGTMAPGITILEIVRTKGNSERQPPRALDGRVRRDFTSLQAIRASL